MYAFGDKMPPLWFVFGPVNLFINWLEETPEVFLFIGVLLSPFSEITSKSFVFLRVPSYLFRILYPWNFKWFFFESRLNTLKFNGYPGELIEQLNVYGDYSGIGDLVNVLMLIPVIDSFKIKLLLSRRFVDTCNVLEERLEVFKSFFKVSDS